MYVAYAGSLKPQSLFAPPSCMNVKEEKTLKAEAVIWCVPMCPSHNHLPPLHSRHGGEQLGSLGFAGCQQAWFALNPCLSEQEW